MSIRNDKSLSSRIGTTQGTNNFNYDIAGNVRVYVREINKAPIPNSKTGKMEFPWSKPFHTLREADEYLKKITWERNRNQRKSFCEAEQRNSSAGTTSSGDNGNDSGNEGIPEPHPHLRGVSAELQKDKWEHELD